MLAGVRDGLYGDGGGCGGGALILRGDYGGATVVQ